MTATDDGQMLTAVKRPKWVWLVSAFCLVLPPLSAAVLVANHMGWLPSAATQDPSFKSLGALDLTIGLALAAAQFGAGVCLWLLRRQAVPLFMASVVLSVSNFMWQTFARDWLGAMQRMNSSVGPRLVAATALAWAVWIGFWAYAWRLRRTGVLR